MATRRCSRPKYFPVSGYKFTHGTNISLLMIPTVPDMAKVRRWTDRSGGFEVEAQLLGVKNQKIYLHKMNGVKINVPLEKMAIEDVDYVGAVNGSTISDEKGK